MIFMNILFSSCLINEAQSTRTLYKLIHIPESEDAMRGVARLTIQILFRKHVETD